MAIAATGPLRVAALRTEYGSSGAGRLGDYRRGHAKGWVKVNAANNPTTNLSAAVPLSTAPVRLTNFRGQAKGWSYTNTTVRHSYDEAHQHYHCHVEYGDDWAGSTWPCYYINEAAMGSSSTSYYALVIYGRANGPFTFTNKSTIEGAGGQPNSGAGQHAIYIYNTVAGANRPIVVNNLGAYIRGGGGAGGLGGTGGTGSSGMYWNYQPGPSYSTWQPYTRKYNDYRNSSASVVQIFWNGPLVYQGPFDGSTYFLNIGGWDYYVLQPKVEQYFEAPDNWSGYSIRREQYITTGYGGGGGAGGNGGRGQGYSQSYNSGSAGSQGAQGASSSAQGGTGGIGGTGGTWGTVGGTGATGAVGYTASPQGSYPATGGAAGAAGGAAGYAIYAASPFGWVNNGGVSGSVGGGAAPTRLGIII